MKIEHWCTLFVFLLIFAICTGIVYGLYKKAEQLLIKFWHWIRRQPQVENKKRIMVKLETPAPKYINLCNQSIYGKCRNYK